MVLKGKKKLISIVDSMKPDLIHTSGIRADMYAYKYLSNCKSICTVRNYAYDDYPVKFGKLKGTLFAYQHIKTLKTLKNVICCSNAISEKLFTKHQIKSKAVQNGIDIKHYIPTQKENKKKLKEELGLNPNKITYISVGSLIDRKDPVTLIKGFEMAKIGENAELIMLGDGYLFDECNQHSSDLIKLKGQVENVNEYLKAADVFVSTSKSEGLPNAVLEAMGAGLPLLISNIEPHKEIFERCPHIGKLYPIYNQKELVKAIISFTHLDLIEMGKKSRQTVEEFFSSEVMSKSYQKIYKSITER